MSLDMSNWKNFRFGDLISNIHKAKAINKDDLTVATDSENAIRYITRTGENNGCELLADLRDVDSKMIEKGNAISIGDTTATCFYQEEDFITGDHMVVIRADSWLNPYTALYIVAILTKEQYKYSYGRAYLMDRIKETVVKLPVDSDGNPDYHFMEDYIKSLNHKPLTTKNKQGQAPDLNVNNWKAFKTSRIFDNLQNGKANQQMLEAGNDCFYVGAKKDDNGVMFHCKRDENLITKGNCVVFICNGQGSVGFANYMDVDFIGTTDIVAGYNENLNESRGIFLATIYSQERPKYSFGRKWKTHLADTEVKLPILHDVNGNEVIDDSCKYSDEGYLPDWQFMENYIKALPYGDRLRG